IGYVRFESGFSRYALRLAVGIHWTRIDPLRKPEQARALGAIPAHQFALSDALKIGHEPDALAAQTLLHHFSNPPDQADRLPGQESNGFSSAEDGKAARLIQIGSDLG